MLAFFIYTFVVNTFICMQAFQEIITGVDVVISTPPSLLRIMNRKVLNLAELRHLVSVYFWY